MYSKSSILVPLKKQFYAALKISLLHNIADKKLTDPPAEILA